MSLGEFDQSTLESCMETSQQHTFVQYTNKKGEDVISPLGLWPSTCGIQVPNKSVPNCGYPRVHHISELLFLQCPTEGLSVSSPNMDANNPDSVVSSCQLASVIPASCVSLSYIGPPTLICKTNSLGQKPCYSFQKLGNEGLHLPLWFPSCAVFLSWVIHLGEAKWVTLWRGPCGTELEPLSLPQPYEWDTWQVSWLRKAAGREAYSTSWLQP
jgi:hypothetical protein